jgi:hypothetical protein
MDLESKSIRLLFCLIQNRSRAIGKERTLQQRRSSIQPAAAMKLVPTPPRNPVEKRRLGPGWKYRRHRRSLVEFPVASSYLHAEQ